VQLLDRCLDETSCQVVRRCTQWNRTAVAVNAGDIRATKKLLTTLAHAGTLSVGESLVQNIHDCIRVGSTDAQIRYVWSLTQMKPSSLNALCFKPIRPCSGVSTMCFLVHVATSCSGSLQMGSDTSLTAGVLTVLALPTPLAFDTFYQTPLRS
jgi:hypothetical protein